MENRVPTECRKIFVKAKCNLATCKFGRMEKIKYNRMLFTLLFMQIETSSSFLKKLILVLYDSDAQLCVKIIFWEIKRQVDDMIESTHYIDGFW